MVSLRYFVLCNLASMDQRKRLSCHGIFDSWGITSIPSILNTFYIAFGIDGLESGKKASVYLSLRDPKGSYIWKRHRLNVISEDNYSPIICVLEIVNFPVNTLGIFTFEVFHKSKLIGKYPLKIYRIEEGDQSE